MVQGLSKGTQKEPKVSPRRGKGVRGAHKGGQQIIKIYTQTTYTQTLDPPPHSGRLSYIFCGIQYMYIRTYTHMHIILPVRSPITYNIAFLSDCQQCARMQFKRLSEFTNSPSYACMWHGYFANAIHYGRGAHSSKFIAANRS